MLSNVWQFHYNKKFKTQQIHTKHRTKRQTNNFKRPLFIYYQNSMTSSRQLIMASDDMRK